MLDFELAAPETKKEGWKEKKSQNQDISYGMQPSKWDEYIFLYKRRITVNVNGEAAERAYLMPVGVEIKELMVLTWEIISLD